MEVGVEHRVEAAGGAAGVHVADIHAEAWGGPEELAHAHLGGREVATVEEAALELGREAGRLGGEGEGNALGAAQPRQLDDRRQWRRRFLPTSTSTAAAAAGWAGLASRVERGPVPGRCLEGPSTAHGGVKVLPA